MYVWRALLHISAQQHPQSGHVALDSTFFEHGHASQYYLQRSERDIKKLKVTTLTDTESLAVLDLQCSIHWKHDVKAGPQVVWRNDDDLLSVAADKAFHSWTDTFEFYTLDFDPLVLKQGLKPETAGHNALTPGCRVLKAVDGRNVVLVGQALARLGRASALLVPRVP